MRTSSFRRVVVPGVATLAFMLTACGPGSVDDGSDSGSADIPAEVSGELAIGGSSAQESAQNAWLVGFGNVAPEAIVTYDPIGSGGGRENFISGAYPMAGTDAYLSDEEGELTDATERCLGDAPIEIPNYVSPIAVIFNLDDVDELNLSPATVAGIFAGTIKQWDDAAIAEDNPDADLPPERIVPVHRSDESGTTENFTDYLDAVASDEWTLGVVETWPTEAGGEAGKGTAGVVQIVTDAPNTIGYADASQARGLGQARIGVGEEFVDPSAQAAARILEVSPRVAEGSEVNMAVDLDHETTESGTYPVVLTSYLLACQSYEDQAQADMVKAYISYILSDDGQEIAEAEAGSAPLPEDIKSEAASIVESISVG